MQNKLSASSFLLAPMEGVTDVATRLWLSMCGFRSEAVTPFLRITENFPAKRVSPHFLPEEMKDTSWRSHLNYSVVPQLMGTLPKSISLIAKHLLENSEVQFVDINCGCPAPMVVGNGGGSGLLKSAEIFTAFWNEMFLLLPPKRWSVKMRLGFESDTLLPQFISFLAEKGVARITLHGRTREQRYTGDSNLRRQIEAFEQLQSEQKSRAKKTEFVFSGDFFSSSEIPLPLEPYFDAGNFGCKIMIGRGALRNPWIFAPNQKLQTCLVVVKALKIYACLQECLNSFPSLLGEIVKSGYFGNETLGIEKCNFHLEDYWQSKQTELLLFLEKKHAFEMHNVVVESQFSAGTLARLKMLWNYLRSSVVCSKHSIEFVSQPLRTRSAVDFFESLKLVLSEIEEYSGFEFKHQPQFNWLYSGEGKPRD